MKIQPNLANVLGVAVKIVESGIAHFLILIKMTYTIIQQGEREMYQCDKCGIVGSCAKTIELEFCHRRNNERHRDDIPATITKKKEMKNKFRGTGIGKFNKYFEE